MVDVNHDWNTLIATLDSQHVKICYKKALFYCFIQKIVYEMLEKYIHVQCAEKCAKNATSCYKKTSKQTNE